MAVAAVAAVVAWMNSRTDLVGKDNPIPLGAFRRSQRPRSPGQGAYILISQVGGSPDLVAEGGVSRARISAALYAGTEDVAEAAAVAYAGALEALSGEPVQMGAVARCLVADNIAGPLQVDAPDEHLLLVDADFYLT